jgi:excisionase family DNA binding protein
MTLTTKQAAEYLNLSDSYVEKLRVRGGGPLFKKIGRSVRYSTGDLDEFLVQRTRRSTSDRGLR